MFSVCVIVCERTSGSSQNLNDTKRCNDSMAYCKLNMMCHTLWESHSDTGKQEVQLPGQLHRVGVGLHVRGADKVGQQKE